MSLLIEIDRLEAGVEPARWTVFRFPADLHSFNTLESMRQLALVAFLAIAMARGRPVQADSLASFNKVAICAPVNAKITPGSGYSYQLDSDDSVKAALKFTVSGGTLSVETEADFTAQQPVKLTIKLPADQLRGVDTRTSNVLVTEGFSSGSGLIVANAGTGRIVLQAARAGSFAIQASG